MTYVIFLFIFIQNKNNQILISSFCVIYKIDGLIMWNYLNLLKLKIERQGFVLYFSILSFTMKTFVYRCISHIDGRVLNTATSTVQIWKVQHLFFNVLAV